MSSETSCLIFVVKYLIVKDQRTQLVLPLPRKRAPDGATRSYFFGFRAKQVIIYLCIQSVTCLPTYVRTYLLTEKCY